MLVIAIDDREKAADIVELAKGAFPNLTVLARAFDRRHAYELLNRGADQVERETFEGGLALAMETLQGAGLARLPRRARHAAVPPPRRAADGGAAPAVGRRGALHLGRLRESSPRMDDLLRSDIERLTEAMAEDDWDTEDWFDEQGRRRGGTTVG